MVHALIFLVLLFTVMKTSVPPFPEAGGSGGVIVNIGYLDEAGGLIQPVSENITVDPSVNKIKQQSQPEENYATQDLEETPIVKENKEIKKNVVKPTNTPVNTTKIEKKIVQPAKTVDPRAIYKGTSNNSKSQGTGVGAGDQGDPKGDPNSSYQGPSGTGTGTGQGDGEGTGSGSGKGVSFSLSGRKMVRTPQINDRSQETGKVVVDITVDKDGNVVAAIPGGRGSTTTSAYLMKLAKDAAMKAKFNPSPEGADIQKGTISFVFLVQ